MLGSPFRTASAVIVGSFCLLYLIRMRPNIALGLPYSNYHRIKLQKKYLIKEVRYVSERSKVDKQLETVYATCTVVECGTDTASEGKPFKIVRFPFDHMPAPGEKFYCYRYNWRKEKRLVRVTM